MEICKGNNNEKHRDPILYLISICKPPVHLNGFVLRTTLVIDMFLKTIKSNLLESVTPAHRNVQVNSITHWEQMILLVVHLRFAKPNFSLQKFGKWKVGDSKHKRVKF